MSEKIAIFVDMFARIYRRTARWTAKKRVEVRRSAVTKVAAVIAGALLLSCKAVEPLPDVEGAKIRCYGGRERILCRWEGVPDAIQTVRLTFSDTAVEAPARGEGGSQVWIDGRPEGDERLDVTFLTKSGKAVPGPNIGVRVYGNKYESGLQSRMPQKVLFENHRLSVTFSPEGDKDIVGEDIRHVEEDGSKIVRFYPRTGDAITLEGILQPGEYRSVFVPTPETGDQFYAPFTDFPGNGYVAPLPEEILPTVDGYRGIWFALGQVNTEYGDKYSGGLGTYTMKHIPMAVYAPEAEKTFFVYGGTPTETQKYLQCMIGCYDHRKGLLQKPRMVMDKGVLGVKDPHDNPTVQIDRDGYIWVFVSGRSNKREGYRYRSVNPYDITAFREVNHDTMAYPQVMYHPDKGFFLFYTRYDGVRQLFWRTSLDGVNWTAYKQLASIKEGSETKSGHYQISNLFGTKLCTAFNRHINGGVDTRTNIYYVQSTDWGETWTTASGEAVTVPVTQRYSNALLIDYQSQGKNCYIKDLNFDPEGRPVILYLISDNHLTGPEGGIREWFTLYWNGTEWEQTKVTESTHCYDSGSLWVDTDGGGETWTILAPTGDGPQYWGAGGEVEEFVSTDRGKTWTKTRALTSGSTLNNTYVRRPLRADDGFRAFWADGNPDLFTRSSLYFCTRSGEVFRMPYDMTDEWALPIRVGE